MAEATRTNVRQNTAINFNTLLFIHLYMFIMIFLTLIVIYNFNINVFFNHYNFIVIIICNVGSHSTHFECTYVDMSVHFLAICLVCRADDGLVNSSETCNLCI